MLLVALSFMFLIMALGIRSVSAQTRMPSFALKNQKEESTEVNFPGDRPVVLIFGDRKGAGQISGWAGPLYEKYTDKIYIFGVASLGGVPGFAQGLVRRLIKRQTSNPVLLDWSGKLADSVGYEKDKALVVLLKRDGSVVSKRAGAATGGEIESLAYEIDRLI